MATYPLLPSCASLPTFAPSNLNTVTEQIVRHVLKEIRTIVAQGPTMYSGFTYMIRLTRQGAIQASAGGVPDGPLPEVLPNGDLAVQRFFALHDANPRAEFYRVVPDETGVFAGDLREALRYPETFRWEVRRALLEDDTIPPSNLTWEFFRMEALSASDAIRYVYSRPYAWPKQGGIEAWINDGYYPRVLQSLSIEALRAWRATISETALVRIGGDLAFADAMKARLREKRV